MTVFLNGNVRPTTGPQLTYGFVPQVERSVLTPEFRQQVFEFCRAPQSYPQALLQIRESDSRTVSSNAFRLTLPTLSTSETNQQWHLTKPTRSTISSSASLNVNSLQSPLRASGPISSISLKKSVAFSMASGTNSPKWRISVQPSKRPKTLAESSMIYLLGRPRKGFYPIVISKHCWWATFIFFDAWNWQVIFGTFLRVEFDFLKFALWAAIETWRYFTIP